MIEEIGDTGLPYNTPAELTAIQEMVDLWVERGVMITKRVNNGTKTPIRIFYRVAHPWELENPERHGKRKHVHDWRHDMLRQGTHEGIIYCTGCPMEVTRTHDEFADPRVIRHKNDGLGNGNRDETLSDKSEDALGVDEPS